ncbi:MAG TPA: hypothetical protein VL201_05230 [Patescibacteria group bacterium]|jgi:hypothetical protein|nr:hypothetical protein [Patescibacteria group bacterium]
MRKVYSFLFCYFLICIINKLYCSDINPIYKENCWFAFDRRSSSVDGRGGNEFEKTLYRKKYPSISMIDYFEFDVSKIKIIPYLVEVPFLFALFSPINLFLRSSPYLLPSYLVMSLGLSTTWCFSILYFYNTVQYFKKGKYFIKNEDTLIEYLISVKNGRYEETETEADISKTICLEKDEHICHCENKKALFNHQFLNTIQLCYSIDRKISKVMFLRKSTYLFSIFLAVWFLYVRNVMCCQSFNGSLTYKIFMEGVITILMHIGLLIRGNITMRHALTGCLISCYKDFVMRLHNI